MKNVLSMKKVLSIILSGCSLGCLGSSFASAILAVVLIAALIASLASCEGQALVSVAKGAAGIAKGVVGVGITILKASSPPLIAVDAIALASHLNGPSLQNYDPSDPFMKNVISDWLPTCHSKDGSLCEVASNGDLQCVEFVTGSYLLAGISLPYAHDAHYFWSDYQSAAAQSEWQEIPVGTGLPQMGDIVVWRSWHYDAKAQVRVEDAGHVAVVAAIVAPRGNTPGRVYLAEANILHADELPTVREALTQSGEGKIISILNPMALNARVGEMTIYPDLNVKDDKKLENIKNSSGSVVYGYIRHISPATGSPTGSPGANYQVTGPPTITAAFINQVLAFYHSPASGKGQALYDLGVQYGIDPAFALAFFMHESSFGTSGVASVTLSLGNIRATPGYDSYDGFRKYATWEAGFQDWYQLIKSLYVEQWHLTTVAQIIPVYAPSSDNNDVNAYIQSVERAIDTWRGGKVQV